MGICPRCGSWVDEGEPYCPECCYDGSDSEDEDSEFTRDSDMITVNGTDYSRWEVEDALWELGCDFNDLKLGYVDEDELEELLMADEEFYSDEDEIDWVFNKIR